MILERRRCIETKVKAILLGLLQKCSQTNLKDPSHSCFLFAIELGL